VGSKRIGVAVSDLLGITAQGLETLQRQNKRLDFEKLAKLIREYKIAQIVVGYPLRMSGEEGLQAEKMQRFADELRERCRLPVHLWMSGLHLPRQTACCARPICPSGRRGQVVDQMAAVLILQSWMESRLHPADPGETVPVERPSKGKQLGVLTRVHRPLAH